MNDSKLYLFKDKRFINLFITQLCGCLNDNILKNALTILIAYKVSNTSIIPANFLILIVNAIFILPYVIFAGIAGQIADKLEKSYLISIIKATEFIIVIVAIYGFTNNSITTLLLSICLMGIHSTFYGPLKYSMLSDHLNKDELLGANGYVEAGTFLSILVGTILGGIYNSGASLVISLMLVIAIVGFIASLFIPKSNNYDSSIEINFNIFSEIINIVKYSESKRSVFLAILGIAWFWFLGGTLLSQIPLLTKDIFYADENVANLFLAVFSIGVGIGSFWCNKLLSNEITTDYVFIATIGISVFGIDLYFASRISAADLELTQLRSIIIFLSQKHNWRILFDLFAISTISGLYVVPLYAVMQYFTAPGYRSRVIAANNLIGAAFMCISNILLSLLFKLGCTVPFIILFISLINLIVAGYVYHFLPSVKIVPMVILKSILRFVFDKIYRVKVEGLENFYNAGPRAVIIANHVSYLDPPLLTTYLPEKLIFAIHANVAQEFWVRPFLKMVKAYSVDHSNAIAIKSLIREVKKNQKVVIFPEGRISTTGSLMKIYEGPGMIADRANAVILPIHIDGPQHTIFSKLGDHQRTKFFPKVKITVLPPVRLNPILDLDLRQRRKYISHRLYDIMVDMAFKSTSHHQQLFQSLIDASKHYGMSKVILQDIVNNNLTYRQCLVRSFLLGKLLNKIMVRGTYVGVMLPNSTNTTIVLFACAAYGFIPAIINFTLGASNIISLCRTVGINIICTSRLFIEKSGLEDLDTELKKLIKVVYLEDLRNELKFTTKVAGWLAGFFPQMYYNIVVSNDTDSCSPAVILFTSGTESQPKAVVLSHSNLLANIGQVIATTDFLSSDVVFNALPMFHSFGLTATILSLLTGMRTFLYPSPLDYRIIPEMVYDVGATILFGTNTFLNNYSRYSHPYDFYSLRRVYAGAEKLREDTCELWFKKHGIRIFEGYGATEASPVISGNTAMHYKPNTVGKMMPGIKYAILKIDGIQKGGKLCIKGPNIMLGYISPSSPGVIVPPKVDGLGNGWYDTGDVVTIDEESYVTITARVKRFAKIAGEMISLVSIEEIAHNIDDSGNHAALYVDDKNRGEQIILCTDTRYISTEKLLEYILKMNLSRLHMPKHIIYLSSIPFLPSGKIDYRALDNIIREDPIIKSK